MTTRRVNKAMNKTEIEMFIVNKVRKIRESRNVGQKKLSLELKLSVSFVGNVENIHSKAKYNFNHLNEIARYFNVPFSYFFPETHLETDCVEEYLEIHPKLKVIHEKMMENYDEKSRKKLEDRKKAKVEVKAKKK